MAAAVVPSRARAAARPPNPAAGAGGTEASVTYVRMTLIVDTLRAPNLHDAPTRYFFRWMRSGKLVKRTSACALDRSPAATFGQKLTLYASVKRQGAAFVSEDDTDTLQTELILVQAHPTNPDAPGTPVASLPFDVGHYLFQLVQGGLKTLTTQLNFSTDISANVSINVKAPGGNLRPIATDDMQRPQPVVQTSPKPLDDEAAAAAQLEKLRQNVRAKEGRADRGGQEHGRHMESPKAAALGVDVVSLKSRIHTLEQQKALVEREREEAERKVSAHVAHAAKIKATYSQLATWYNNLRQEHAELQKRLPASPSEQTEASRDVPSSVIATREADYKSLEQERDALRTQLERERSEKKEMHTHNSGLLENRARTLAELREQWDGTQMALASAQKTTEEQSRQLRGLQDQIEGLQSQLSEKDNMLDKRSSELTRAIDAFEQLQMSQQEATQRALKEGREEAQAEAQREIEELRKQHDERSAKMFADAKAAQEDDVEIKLSRLREEHAQELVKLRSQVEAEQFLKHEAELNRVRNESEEAKATLSETASLEAEKARELMNQKVSALESEKEALESQLEERVRDIDSHRGNGEKELDKLKEAHQQELHDMRTQTLNLENELSRAKEELKEERSRSVKALEEERGRASDMEKDLETMHAELHSLRKANHESEVSARETMVSQGENEKTLATLKDEIFQLREKLNAEKDKRNESERELATVNGEHHELRGIVARLRFERDEALGDLKKARETVPSPNVNIGSVRQNGFGTTEEFEPESLVEQRDKAIRELFRVRKGLNKELRRLKKENTDLSEQLQLGAQGQDENRVADSDDVKAELGSLQSRNVELEAALSSASEKHREAIDALNGERSSLQRALDDAGKEVSSSAQELKTKDEKIRELLATAELSSQKLRDTESHFERAREERNEASAKANLLSAELESLKDSLAKASSSNSSTEALLSTSQRELAESKAKIEQLSTRVRDLETSVGSREIEAKEEVDRLKNELERQSLSSRNADVAKDKAIEELKSVNASLLSRLDDKDRSLQRLNSVETELSERDSELAQAKESLQSLEASERILRQESGDAESSRAKVLELQTELAHAKSRLEEKTRQLAAEVESRSAVLDRGASNLSDLQNEKESVSAQLTALQVRFDASQDELRTVQESYSNLESILEKVQEKATRLEKSATDKSRECNELSVLLSDLRAKEEETESKYTFLAEKHHLAKQDLAQMQKETSSLEDDKMSFAERIKSLEEEIGSMNERISFMQEEHEEELASVRTQSEKEARKAAEMRKDLRSARAQAESLQAEVEQLRASNAELRKARESMKENSDGREAEVLNDLINTRMELAYAREETIRLRNRLKKLGQSSQPG